MLSDTEFSPRLDLSCRRGAGGDAPAPRVARARCPPQQPQGQQRACARWLMCLCELSSLPPAEPSPLPVPAHGQERQVLPALVADERLVQPALPVQDVNGGVEDAVLQAQKKVQVPAGIRREATCVSARACRWGAGRKAPPSQVSLKRESARWPRRPTRRITAAPADARLRCSRAWHQKGRLCTQRALAGARGPCTHAGTIDPCRCPVAACAGRARAHLRPMSASMRQTL